MSRLCFSAEMLFGGAEKCGTRPNLVAKLDDSFSARFNALLSTSRLVMNDAKASKSKDRKSMIACSSKHDLIQQVSEA